MKDRLSNISTWIKDNKVKSSLIIIFVICLMVGASYAYFVAGGSGSIKNLAMGTLNINYIDGETINSTNSLPILEDEVDEYASKTSFSIKNSGDLTAYTEISLLINNLPSALDSNDFRWTLYREEDPISTGSFKNAGSKLVLKNEEIIYPSETVTNYSIAIWIRDNGGNQNSMLNQSLNAKISVQAKDKKGEYAESGINPPELVEGLIPVVYDDTKDVWVKANVRKKWYSYNNQEWANAVTVTSTNRSKYESAKAGTEIAMTDINSMWVWIPRYKYKISSGIGSSSALTNPPQIDVVFETGLKSTGVSESVYRNGIGTDGTNTNYYTHPVFRNGEKVYNITPYDIGGWDKELTGIWIGKFETGNTATSPMIKPDIKPLVSQNISTQFTTSLTFAGGTMNTSTGKVTFSGNTTYGLTGTTDTHMIKNTEWGAVAILSQSQYGKMGNANYTGTNKEIYFNNSSGMYTGRSLGAPSPSTVSSTTYGTYSYNDKACSNASCTGNETINAGTGASTTGTIYGIYDMSGGSIEYTMGNWKKYSGTSNEQNSGFIGTNCTSCSISFPENKYYDLYGGTSSTSITKEKAILGDASWETMYWYSDAAGSIMDSNPWIRRSGSTSNTSNAGIYYTYNGTGNALNYASFHTVLIP